MSSDDPYEQFTQLHAATVRTDGHGAEVASVTHGRFERLHTLGGAAANGGVG